MALIRYENRLPVLMRRFMDGEMEEWNDHKYHTSPAVNIKELADDFVIEIAAPGYQKEDFEVELDHNRLTISATKKQDENLTKDEEYIRKEFNYQDFKHTFSLTEWVVKHKIDADYTNGILKVIIPKKEEIKPQPLKKIKVK